VLIQRNEQGAEVTAKTRGEIEAGIGTAVVQIQRRITGRGPRCSIAHLSGAQLVVRLLGGLTPAEEHLLKCSCGQEKCRETEVVRELRRAPL